MHARPWALMRPVSPSIADCELSFQTRLPIDADRARQQHQLYAQQLRRLGVELFELDEAPELPDACFVEDLAVILGTAAVVCRLGASSRRDEAPPVREFLRRQGYDLVEMPAPATADGGDILVIDDQVLIGLSARTNPPGAALIADAARAAGLTPSTIEVAGALHLKTVCTYAGNELILADPTKLGRGREVIEQWKVFTPPAVEVGATNVRRCGQHVLLPTRCPRTAQRLQAAGLSPREVEISELQKAEAGLTCMVLAP